MKKLFSMVCACLLALSAQATDTKKHRAAIREFGATPYHRMSYNLLGTGELSLDFKD